MIEIQQARPPYVQFELRAVEDRNASLEAGHYIAKDVAFDRFTMKRVRKVLDRGRPVAALANETRFHRDGDRFLVRTEGPDGAAGDFAVTHTFGVWPLQQCLVAQPGGRSVDELFLAGTAPSAAVPGVPDGEA